MNKKDLQSFMSGILLALTAVLIVAGGYVLYYELVTKKQTNLKTVSNERLDLTINYKY